MHRQNIIAAALSILVGVAMVATGYAKGCTLAKARTMKLKA